MAVQNHVHKLRKHKYKNGTEVFFCSQNCDYKVDVGLALGKESICNICGNTFTMNEYSLKLVKPHCTGCGKVKVKDKDGKSRFINKARPTAAIAEMGQSAASTLRQRLGTVTTMEKDEDI